MTTLRAVLVFLLCMSCSCIITANPLPDYDENYAFSPQYDDIDDDDTEVIEIPSNSIEQLPQNSKDIIDLSSFGLSLYGMPDETIGDLVNKVNEDSVNPEELGSYVEGDILIPGNQALTKNGVVSQSSRWINGIVPFEIRGSFSSQDIALIQLAMDEYHRRTCIRFIPRSSEQDYISIVNGNSGCWSSVGRIGGKQEVNLQSPGCLSKIGTPLHELMHALGFLHEQNRQERDSFVRIQYNNIQPSAKSNFEKAAATNAFGVPYDYGSVMHYSANAFSSNGQSTIMAMQPGMNARMGQRDGFSAYDVDKLNGMYDCGYGGSPSGPKPAPVPAPVGPGAAAGNSNIISSFLGGLISGLGLAEEPAAAN